MVKDINEPRVPSLKGKMKAKKAEIRRLRAADIGADPALHRTARLSDPGGAGLPARRPRGNRTVFTGSIDEQIDQLLLSSKLAVASVGTSGERR